MLDPADHRALTLWATDCAEHVLSYFEEKYPLDPRPREAIEAGRAWAHGEIAVSAVRDAALAAHASAREADQGSARAAARAAEHAAATAYAAGDARHAAAYAVSAATFAPVSADPANAAAAALEEREWQNSRLESHLHVWALSDSSH